MKNQSLNNIMTVSGKEKDLYDNKKAEITILNLSTMWVKLLEGPCVGTTIKRTIKQIKLIVDTGAAGTVKAAGVGEKKAESVGGEGDAREGEDKKRRRLSESLGESRAASIFARAKSDED